MEESAQKSADSSLSLSVESFQEYETQSQTNLLKPKHKKRNNNHKTGKKKKKKKSKRGGRKGGGYNCNNTNTLGKEAFSSSSTESVTAESDIDVELLEEAKVNDEGEL